MKRPAWRRRSSKPSEDEEEKGIGSSAAAERAERERLRDERRRRAAKARADLGQKAGGPEVERSTDPPAKFDSPKKAAPQEKSGEVRGKHAGETRSEEGKKRRLGGKPTSPKKLDGDRRKLRAPDRKRRTDEEAKGSRRSRAHALATKTSSAFKTGSGETRSRLRQGWPIVGAKVLAVLAAAFGLFFGLLAIVVNGGIALVRIAKGPVRRFLLRARQALGAASRILTPSRAMALVVVVAAILLALSQFADYRSVSIGNEDYAAGIQTVAPAPERDREAAGSAHSYAFVPVAAVCLLLLPFAMRGRWRLCRLIALGGAAAVVVALVVDRPAGLDPGSFAVRFNGAEANLLSGFYAQISAGVLLMMVSLLLGRELRLAGADEPARKPRRVSAGGRLTRRRAPAGGARA